MIDSSGLSRYSIYSARWKKHDNPYTVKKGKQQILVEGYYLPGQRISVSVPAGDLMDSAEAAENSKQ